MSGRGTLARGAVAVGICAATLLPSAVRAQGKAQVPAVAPAPAEVDAAKLSKAPKQTKFVEAEYPQEAVDKGITAEVVLLLDISAAGKVTGVGVVEPATLPGLGFDEAAMVAAQGFEFSPAEIDGKPVAVQLTYRYRFTLKPKAPPAPEPVVAPEGAAATPIAPPAAPKPQVVNYVGLLRERGTRLPMPGVLVTVFREIDAKPVGFEATTNADGKFEFYDLLPGEWRVLIEAPGYYPFKTIEGIEAGLATQVTYYAERASYNPFDVRVTAARPRKEVSRTVLAAKEIDKIPGTAGDPLAVVQNFAGVARSPLGSGQIVVRGSAPEDTRIFVDGAEVPLIYHFGGLRSVLPIGMLDAIEFYPGNFAPMYGRATGGIIDVQVKKLEPKKVGGYADVSLLDTGVFLEVPLGKKGGVALAARRSYIDGILNAVVPSDAPVNIISAPRYYDYQLLANYRPAPAHDFRAFLFGADDSLKLLFKNPADLDTAVTDNRFSASTSFYRSLLTYRYIPNERFENSVRLSQGRNWFDFKVGKLRFDLNVYSTQLRDNVRYKLADWISVSAGVDVLYSKSDVNIQLPRPPKEGEPMGGNFDLSDTLSAKIDNAVFWSPAAFAELELRPLAGLLILPGVRVDHFQRTSQSPAQPRLTARYQVTPQVAAKGGVGLFVQEPDFEETDKSFGNPNLKAERALHYSAGAEFKPRPHITLDGTVFYKDMSSLVSRTDTLTTGPMGPRPLVYDNGGTGRVYGLELLFRHEFTDKFSGWLAYTLSRAERRDSGETSSRLFDFDQTHILTLLGSYSLPRNWLVGGRFRLVSGNPITPVSGSVFNALSDRYDPTFGPPNSARNQPFHQLDLRVDKRWIYQSWILSVYLDIQNVYNRANPEGLNYNFDYRKSKVQQGLPILPILGVRGEF